MHKKCFICLNILVTYEQHLFNILIGTFVVCFLLLIFVFVENYEYHRHHVTMTTRKKRMTNDWSAAPNVPFYFDDF